MLHQIKYHLVVIVGVIMASLVANFAIATTFCADYAAEMHVVANVATGAQFSDQVGTLVYTSSFAIIDVSMPGAPQIVGSFVPQDGAVRGIIATTDRLYTIWSAAPGAGFNGLAVYTLTDPLAPVLVGRLALPPFPTQLRVVGQMVYVRNDQGMLFQVDASNPATLPVRGFIGQGWLDSFDVRGDYLYAVDRVRDDVVVIPATGTLPLRIVHRLGLSGVSAITFAGDQGYFLNAAGGTQVLSFSSPADFTVVNSLPGLDRPLVIHGSRGYLYGLPFQAYDLRDTVQPSLVLTVPFVVQSGGVVGDRALVGISESFVELDVTNRAPLAPLVGGIEVPASLTTMIPVSAAGDDYLVTLSRSGLDVYDVRDCANPLLSGTLPWQERVTGAAVEGANLFVMTAGMSAGQSVLKVYGLSEGAAPVVMASVALPGELVGLTAVGRFLYTSERGALVVIDAAVAAAPHLYSRLDGAGFSAVVAVAGANLVVADGTMLRHFDVSSPGSPVPTTAIDTGVDGVQILCDEATTYFAYREGVLIYDTDPFGVKNQIGRVTVPGRVDGIARQGEMLYVEGSGIFMVDVSVPGSPVFAGNLGYVADRSEHLTVLGDCLYFDHYLSRDRGRIEIAALACQTIAVAIDINPCSVLNRITCEGEDDDDTIAVAILTTGQFDALSVDHTTVRFGPGNAREEHRHEKDVDNDGDLDLLFHFQQSASGIVCGDVSAGLTGVTFAGMIIEGNDTIVTGSGDGDGDGDDDGSDGDDDCGDGDRDGDEGHEGDGEKRVSRVATVTLAPNPFNPQTAVIFELPVRQQLQITVYDLTGRRLAVLADAVFQAGQNRVVWHGTDGSGRSLGSGVYLIRLKGPGVDLRRRAVILK